MTPGPWPPERCWWTTRLYDHGFVTSSVAQADGSTLIQIDRVIEGRPNQSTTVYSYRVPKGVPFGGDPAPVLGPDLRGRTVTISTDGQVVTTGIITSN